MALTGANATWKQVRHYTGLMEISRAALDIYQLTSLHGAITSVTGHTVIPSGPIMRWVLGDIFLKLSGGSARNSATF